MLIDARKLMMDRRNHRDVVNFRPLNTQILFNVLAEIGKHDEDIYWARSTHKTYWADWNTGRGRVPRTKVHFD